MAGILSAHLSYRQKIGTDANILDISDILQIRLFSNESSTTLCYVPLCVSLSLRITGKDDDRGDDDEKTMLLTMTMVTMKKDNNNSNDTYLPILI